MRNKIVVLEGPRLSGKTHLFEKLNLTPGYHGGQNTGSGPYWVAPRDNFDHRIKDDGFIRRNEFNFIREGGKKYPSLIEAYVIGKDASLTQRLSETHGSILVDRYMITSAVYSRVFRKMPRAHGMIYIENMMKFIQQFHPSLKERLHFIVLIPDIDIALEETIKGREGKDEHLGMEDTRKALKQQEELYKFYGETLDRWNFKIDFVQSFQTNPDVKKEIQGLI